MQFQSKQPAAITPLIIACSPLHLQALGCVLYACFILGRLCIPVFANMSREPFSTRALVLSILHATLPGKPSKMAGKGCTSPRKGLSGKALLSTCLHYQHLPLICLAYLSLPVCAHCYHLSSAS
jgi:hypothetical protein